MRLKEEVDILLVCKMQSKTKNRPPVLGLAVWLPCDVAEVVRKGKVVQKIASLP